MFGQPHNHFRIQEDIFEVDLKSTGDPVILEADNRLKVEPFPWSPGYVICSLEVRHVLEGIAPGEFDYVDVQIREGGSVWFDVGRYFVLSARRIVVCHDIERTTWRKDPDVRKFDKFVFDPSRVPAGIHCFRPAGRVVWQVVSAEIRAALAAHKFRGCTFHPVAEVF